MRWASSMITYRHSICMNRQARHESATVQTGVPTDHERSETCTSSLPRPSARLHQNTRRLRSTSPPAPILMTVNAHLLQEVLLLEHALVARHHHVEELALATQRQVLLHTSSLGSSQQHEVMRPNSFPGLLCWCMLTCTTAARSSLLPSSFTTCIPQESSWRDQYERIATFLSAPSAPASEARCSPGWRGTSG